METISERDRRTPFLKRENIIIKYKGKAPNNKKPVPGIMPLVVIAVKHPDLVIPVKQPGKICRENEVSSFWL